MTEPPKTIAESRFALSALMGPQDANPQGNVHGGIIMKMADEAGALTAMRHARTQVVTVAIDSMTFVEPISVGDLVVCEAELTYTGRTSMEVRVEVRAENPLHGSPRVTNRAYLVYVALDPSGHPTPIPPLHYQTPLEEARAIEAQERQNFRKQQQSRERKAAE